MLRLGAILNSERRLDGGEELLVHCVNAAEEGRLDARGERDDRERVESDVG